MCRRRRLDHEVASQKQGDLLGSYCGNCKLMKNLDLGHGHSGGGLGHILGIYLEERVSRTCC